MPIRRRTRQRAGFILPALAGVSAIGSLISQAPAIRDGFKNIFGLGMRRKRRGCALSPTLSNTRSYRLSVSKRGGDLKSHARNFVQGLAKRELRNAEQFVVNHVVPAALGRYSAFKMKHGLGLAKVKSYVRHSPRGGSIRVRSHIKRVKGGLLSPAGYY